jgi:hypothetical protein
MRESAGWSRWGAGGELLEEARGEAVLDGVLQNGGAYGDTPGLRDGAEEGLEGQRGSQARDGNGCHESEGEGGDLSRGELAQSSVMGRVRLTTTLVPAATMIWEVTRRAREESAPSMLTPNPTMIIIHPT